MRVLLVEDEPDIRRVAQASLVHVGKFEVLVASNGLEALEVASREPLDVILLDVMMPDLDGPSTLVRLRESPRTRDIPVIFLTAKIQPSEQERYRALGALGFIGKPFNPMLLAARVRSLLAEGQ